MSISTGKALIHGLIPFGPMKLRIKELNGSADHMWTLFPLFQLPILGLIPTIMMKTGAIKRGRLKGSPVDLFVIVTLLFRFLVGFLVNKLDQPWSSIFNVGLNLIAVMLPFIIRIYSPLCQLCKSNIDQGIDVILKILSSSAVIMAIIEGLIAGLGYVPYVGAIPSMIEMIPILGPILVYAMYFIPLYIYINIKRENNLNKFCSEKVNKIARTMSTIVPIILFIALQKLGDFDPAEFAQAQLDDE